jgi:DNA-binding MarR family transcriptional regulator
MKIEEAIQQSAFRSVHQKAIVNLMFTNGCVGYAQNEILKPFGISLQQYNVLRILRGQHPKPATVSLINERMMDKMSNASRLIDKLLAKELVTRFECPKDRRAVDVGITEKGLLVLQEIDQIQLTFEERLHTFLSEEEAQQLSTLLDKIRMAF